MELPGSVEWALHCAWLLAQAAEGEPAGADPIPGRGLAEFHGVPPAYLSKVLKALTRAGLCTAVTGPRGGYRLARPADEVTVLDVVVALEGDGPVFRCQEIRQRGPVPLSAESCRHPCGIASVMHEAEQAWRDRLAATTLADLVARAGPESRGRARRWLGGEVGARSS